MRLKMIYTPTEDEIQRFSYTPITNQTKVLASIYNEEEQQKNNQINALKRWSNAHNILENQKFRVIPADANYTETFSFTGKTQSKYIAENWMLYFRKLSGGGGIKSTVDWIAIPEYGKSVKIETDSNYTPTGDICLNTFVGWGTSITKTMVVDFLVRSSVPGEYAVNIKTQPNPTFSIVLPYTIKEANTWQRVSLLVPATTNKFNFMQVSWIINNTVSQAPASNEWLTANYNATVNQVNYSGSQYFELTNVQMYYGGLNDFYKPLVDLDFEFEKIAASFWYRKKRYINSFYGSVNDVYYFSVLDNSLVNTGSRTPTYGHEVAGGLSACSVQSFLSQNTVYLAATMLLTTKAVCDVNVWFSNRFQY